MARRALCNCVKASSAFSPNSAVHLGCIAYARSKNSRWNLIRFMMMRRSTSRAYLCRPDMAYRDPTAWLAFLNTVRTERFDQVLALRPLLPVMVKAA
jgi:hypothetical protein